MDNHNLSLTRAGSSYCLTASSNRSVCGSCDIGSPSGGREEYMVLLDIHCHLFYSQEGCQCEMSHFSFEELFSTTTILSLIYLKRSSV